MKRTIAILAALALIGVGCPLNPPPSSPPPTTAPNVNAPETLQGTDELVVKDANDRILPQRTVRKTHRIGNSPCPDSFPPISLEFPEGWGDVALPPTTAVSWLDLPKAIRSGEPFVMKFNCNIGRFDSHGEVGLVSLNFAEYAKNNPGMAHAAGVPSGGTFIVITETWDQPMVPDFALPYVCCSDCASVEYCAHGNADSPKPAPPEAAGQ